MASELSKLIENELEKVEGANRKDEHQKRLSSLRIKTPSPEKTTAGPHPALRFWTKRRVAISLLAGLVLVAAIFLLLSRRPALTAGQNSAGVLSQFDTESSEGTAPTPPAQQVNGISISKHPLPKKAQHPEKQGQTMSAAAPKAWTPHNIHHQHPGSVPGAVETEMAGDAALAGSELGVPDSSSASGVQDVLAPASGAAPEDSAEFLGVPEPGVSDVSPASAPDDFEAAEPVSGPLPLTEAELGR